MNHMFPFGDNIQMIDLNGVQGLSGSFMHLATLEMEEKTYLALGTVRPVEHGAMVNVVMVQETVDEEGEKKYVPVQNLKELSDIVPRLLQAIAPDAEIDLSAFNSSILEEEDDNADMSPFIFDYSGKDNFLS
ncbi:MAG: DUF1292 domain-containing protein [Clostridia bacterium]|nr:DUF1292 domain-containing protein [Clostridia bacterium]